MKNHALFSSKDKSKKLNCCMLQILLGALRVKSVLGLSIIFSMSQLAGWIDVLRLTVYQTTVG